MMEWDESTKLLIKDVAEEAASKTVTQTLTSLGVDTTNPMEVQKDMQHLRQHREGWETSKARGWMALIGVAVVGAVSLLWNGFIHLISGGSTGGTP